jgi:hypothetical protein
LLCAPSPIGFTAVTV